jgi:ABC-type transport system substrate-binding protein
VLDSKLASEISYHVTDNTKIKGSKEVAEGKAKEISGIVADDANYTLKVTLEAPLNIFPNVLSHTVFSPMPKKIVSALPDQTAWENQVMIGNGPFKMAEPWKHDQYIKLVRNDNYFGGFEKHKAYLDGINFVISKDTETAFAGFEAGAADTADIPPGRYADVQTRYPDTNTTKLDTLATYYWGLNTKDPAVGGPANLKLRQAISLSIDRQAIVDTVYSGTRKVATGFTPPGMPGYKANLSSIVKRDLPRAKQLLQEWQQANGGKAPPTVKLNFNAGSGHEPVAAIIQANLKDVGITGTLAPGDSKTYFSEMRKGKGQFLRAGWFWDYVAYDNGMYPLFHTATIGGDNLTLHSDPEFDKLVDEARTATDESKRNELYNKAEKLILDQVIVIPLTWYRGTIVWRPTVKNVQETPLGFLNYESMWLDKS